MDPWKLVVYIAKDFLPRGGPLWVVLYGMGTFLDFLDYFLTQSGSPLVPRCAGPSRMNRTAGGIVVFDRKMLRGNPATSSPLFRHVPIGSAAPE